MAQSMSDIFLSFQQYLETEQDLREEIRVVVRELEQTARGILTILQGIHQPDGLSKIPELCQKSKAAFANVKNQFQVLKSKVPENQYYRFHDHWRFVSQRLVFLAALTTYLESETLIQREEVAAMLGGENSSGLGATASAADLLEQIYNVAEHQDAVEEPANLSQSMSSSQSSLDEQRPSTPHLAPPRGMQRQNAATLSYLRLRGKRELDIENRRLALEEKRLAFEMQKHEDEMREKECKRLAKEEEKKTAAALQDGQLKLIQTLIAKLDKQ